MGKAKLQGWDLDRFQIRIVNIKDRFSTPTSGGWADAMVNFSFAHGDGTHHVMELQLQHAQMLVVRKEGKAHDRYNSFRSTFELLEAVGREPHDCFNENIEDLPPLQKLEQSMERRMESMEQRMENMQQEKDKMQQQIDVLQSRLDDVTKRL